MIATRLALIRIGKFPFFIFPFESDTEVV